MTLDGVMNYENQIFIWRTVTWAMPIIAAILIGISQWQISALESKITNTKRKESADLQKAFEERVIENLNSNLLDKADKGFPGFGISSVLSINNLKEKRRKFILDFGKYDQRDRVSVYLDTDNNLVYRIIDHEGESHIIKVPQKIHTFRAGSTYYLLLEYGFSDTFSFMRVFINDKEVARNRMDFKLNLPITIKPEEMVIAVDKNNANHGKFTISSLMALKGTLTKDQRENLFSSIVKYHESLNR